MNQMLYAGLWLMAALTWSANAAGKWSYVGKTGPLYWHNLFPDACGGENQSPIDLKMEETMYDPDLKDFAIWYDPPRPDSKMFVKNTGYTLQVDLKGDFFVTNAGLGHIYKAVQFHFHWGHKSHQGSEHLLDGEATPIEMHVVTFNQDLYNDIGEAVQQPGGLAVLGVMFELSNEDNPNFDYIIRAMKYIRNPEKTSKVELPLFSLRDLLPHDISSYFRYNGSLTTPGCFESVIWTVFSHKQTISHNQMEQFRKLLQFKRKHHHHHKDGAKDGNRHKRQLSGSDKEKERHAKEVLDELGLHGKDSVFERAALKEQLVHAKSDAGAASTDVPEGRTNIKNAPDYTFVQDNIVNNFRPVQPLNQRAVYRSFKLGQFIEKSQEAQPITGDNGANSATASVAVLVASILTYLFHNLL